jgi:hypothetical protein
MSMTILGRFPPSPLAVCAVAQPVERLVASAKLPAIPNFLNNRAGRLKSPTDSRDGCLRLIFILISPFLVDLIQLDFHPP